MTSSHLLTSDAEFSVFIGPIDHVGLRASLLGVTLPRPAADQRNGLRAVSTSGITRPECRRAGTGPARSVDRPARRPRHQRTTGDQRFRGSQRQPAPS